MKIHSDSIHVRTKKELEIVNISGEVEKILSNSKLSNGIISLFAVGSTCALSCIEFEPGLLKDFPRFLEKVIPKNNSYEHELTWHDGNGHSHVRATLLKPDLTVPFKNGEILTGTWQQIILIELDTHGRDRRIEVQILGE
ncbi:MAG: secondary thiamine-phosphate synthase enzyme YjbQ [archaeon]